MIQPINTTVSTEALASAVTLDDVRSQLGLFSDTSFDDLLTELSIAATEYVGQLVDTYIEPTSLTSTYTDFDNIIDLQQRNVTSITSVSYYDVNEVRTTIDSSSYFLDNTGIDSTVIFTEIPDVTLSEYRSAPVCVTYSVSLNQVELNPQVKQAILLVIQDWFNERAAESDISFSDSTTAALRLLSRLRRYTI